MMTERLKEKRVFFVFGMILSLVLIVSISMYALVYNKLNDLGAKYSLEAHNYVETTTFTWLVQKMCVLAILLIAIVSVFVLDFKIQKGAEMKRINFVALCISLGAFIAILMSIVTSGTLSTINNVQQHLKTDVLWDFDEIKDATTFAYVAKSFDLVFLFSFIGAISFVGMHTIHLHTTKK